MISLLKTEWLKTKRFRTFWVLVVLFAVLLPLFNYRISTIIGNKGQLFNLGYGFPNVWSIFGFWASWFVLFIAFLVIILITNEYRYRTNRQNVIDGWTRIQAFHGKCYMIIMLAAATTLYTGIWTIIFGAAYSNGMDRMTEHMEKLLYFFILCLNYYSFAGMLAFLLKRSGLAIGLFMLYVLIMEFVIMGLLDMLFHNPVPGTFLPLQCSDELLPFSAFKQIMNLVQQEASGSTVGDGTYVIVSLIYIALYYFLTRARLTRNDW